MNDFKEELADILWSYYEYKRYPRKIDIKDFMKWLRSHR